MLGTKETVNGIKIFRRVSDNWLSHETRYYCEKCEAPAKKGFLKDQHYLSWLMRTCQFTDQMWCFTLDYAGQPFLYQATSCAYRNVWNQIVDDRQRYVIRFEGPS